MKFINHRAHKQKLANKELRVVVVVLVVVVVVVLSTLLDFPAGHKLYYDLFGVNILTLFCRFK